MSRAVGKREPQVGLQHCICSLAAVAVALHSIMTGDVFEQTQVMPPKSSAMFDWLKGFANVNDRTKRCAYLKLIRGHSPPMPFSSLLLCLSLRDGGVCLITSALNILHTRESQKI